MKFFKNIFKKKNFEINEKEMTWERNPKQGEYYYETTNTEPVETIQQPDEHFYYTESHSLEKKYNRQHKDRPKGLFSNKQKNYISSINTNKYFDD